MIIDEFVVKYDVYVSNVLFTYKLLSSLAQLMHTHAHVRSLRYKNGCSIRIC